MKKFRFRLEGLYRLRKEDERQAVLVMQELRYRESTYLSQLKMLMTLREEWIQSYNEKGRVPDSQSELLLIEKYLIVLEERRRHQEDELQRLRTEIKIALENVQKTYRARRQVEHIRDRQKAVFDENMKIVERRNTDEMNSLRFIHSGSMHGSEETL